MLTNIAQLEERLKLIHDDLTNLLDHVAILKKERSQPSPGLLENIAALQKKQETAMESLELWKIILKVYPSYDR